MKKLLNKINEEKRIEEMWEGISHIPEDDPNRQSAVEHAIQVQKDIYKQLADQEQCLNIIWPALQVIDSLSPLQAALSISANAERLVPVLQAYKTGGNG
jgi:hypothetical protein